MNTRTPTDPEALARERAEKAPWPETLAVPRVSQRVPLEAPVGSFRPLRSNPLPPLARPAPRSEAPAQAPQVPER